MRRPHWFALAVLVCTPAAGAAPIARTAHLVCGSVALNAVTVLDPHVPPDDGFAWLAQTVTLHAGPEAPPRVLSIVPGPPIPMKDGRQSVPALVTSWQCVHGRGRDVIFLDLQCATPDLGGVCHGEKEWVRLRSTRGTPLDEGYAPQDNRYKALFQQLGVPENLPLLDATGG